MRGTTLDTYIAGIRLAHIDRRLPTEVFNSPYLRSILKGAKRGDSWLPPKRAIPITLDILGQVASNISTSFSELHFNTACKVAFAGFLRLGEFTSKPGEEDKVKIRRSDVFFAEDSSHVILRLRQTKTSPQPVDIVLARTDTSTCPVQALKDLFILDPQELSAPLFRGAGGAFKRQDFLDMLQTKLQKAGIYSKYTGHSFRRGAAQHAIEGGMTEEEVKVIGRWKSEAVKAYYTLTNQQKYALNRRFQTRISTL